MLRVSTTSCLQKTEKVKHGTARVCPLRECLLCCRGHPAPGLRLALTPGAACLAPASVDGLFLGATYRVLVVVGERTPTHATGRPGGSLRRWWQVGHTGPAR